MSASTRVPWAKVLVWTAVLAVPFGLRLLPEDDHRLFWVVLGVLTALLAVAIVLVWTGRLDPNEQVPVEVLVAARPEDNASLLLRALGRS